MALEAVAGSLVKVGLGFAIARLAGDGAVPSGELAGCLLALLPGRGRGEAEAIARALQAEVDVILGGQTSLDKDGAEAALLDANELVQRFGLSGDQLAGLASELSRQDSVHPWRAIADKAAHHVLADGSARFQGDDAHRAFCLRIIAALYRSVLQSDECRQRLLPSLAIAGFGAVRDDLSELKQLLLQRVGAEASVPLAVLREVLARLGDTAETLDAAVIEARLRVKAEEYRELRERLERLTNDDPRVGELRLAALRRLDEADFDGADRLLAEAEHIDLEVVEELQAVARRRRLSAAESRAERAAAACLGLQYRQAAEHYVAAAAMLPADATNERRAYRLEETRVLAQYGDERGDKRALVDAIDRLRALLADTSPSAAPLYWAQIQNNLGNALTTLGGRESGSARLEEAVAAYRDALLERTRERVPPDWAAIQNNLGSALTTLGQREAGTERLGEAVIAYRAALEECTRERVPLEWARTQNNIGSALWTLGEREGDSDRLHAALEAVGAARSVIIDKAKQDQYRSYFDERLASIEASIRDLPGEQATP